MKWPKITWAVPGGLVECPYFIRWIIDFGPFAIRLHKWLGSDDPRAYHDHPYWLWIMVLRGSYTDISATGEDKLHAGSIRFRKADYAHTVQVTAPGKTWSLVITGKPFRRWGFWVNGKLIKRDKYFASSGHHPCDAEDGSVRLKPDGSRIVADAKTVDIRKLAA